MKDGFNIQFLFICLGFLLLTNGLVIPPIMSAMTSTTTDTVGQFEVYEITLTGSAHTNPYTDVNLTADFTGPGGVTFSQEGFWNGDTEWRIRVAPTAVGTWSYVTTSNDTALNNQSGSFECITSASKGFVKNIGYNFCWTDGTPFFRLGDTCWRLFRSYNAAYYSVFKPYIDARAAQGFNFISGVIHTVYKPSINEGGSLWYMDSDLDRLQPPYFEWVDYRVQYMLSKGIIPGLYFVWAQSFDDFTQAQFERFCRYIVARYAAYNVFWIISGEYNETKTPFDYNYHGQIIDLYDPYDHPISIHPTGNYSNSSHYTIFSGWLDFIMMQQYGDYKTLNREIIQDRTYNLPVCNDEYGYEGPLDPADPYYHWSNRTPDQIRKASWSIVMAGGYIQWGCIYTYTGKERVILVDSLNTVGAQQMSILADFVKNDIPFNEMLPDTNIVGNGAFCLSKPGEVYSIYLPDTNEVVIDLSTETGYFKAAWIKPANGDRTDGGAVPAGNQITLRSPLNDDAILLLRRNQDLMAEIKLFLQGAYDSSTAKMRDDLYRNGYLPLDSPYTSTPKSLSALPDSIVDWIRVELRSAPNGPVLAENSALLHKDGRIISDDGNSGIITFSGIPDGSYWLSVAHRNHLCVLSASSHAMSHSSCSVYDFTASDEKYYGNHAAAQIDSGIWGLWSGNANNDKILTSGDYVAWYLEKRSGLSGYRLSDFSLDGLVDDADYTLWLNNAGQGVRSQVP